MRDKEEFARDILSLRSQSYFPNLTIFRYLALFIEVLLDIRDTLRRLV